MSRSAFLPLDDQLCFTLYATSLAINRTYKPMLDALGLTYPQYLVLSLLGERDGATIGAIASGLGLESSTITPPVQRMEKAGLVARRRSTTDERQVQVRLTDAGWALLNRCTCLGETLVERSGMGRAEIDALNRQVRRLRAALNAASDAARDAMRHVDGDPAIGRG